MKVVVVFLILIGILTSFSRLPGQVIQCYYPNWAALGLGKANFIPERIDPFLCTHLTYVYAELDEANYIIHPQKQELDLEFNGGLGLYTRLTAIKRHNPKLKVLLGIGGFLDSHQTRDTRSGRSKYSKLINSRELRRHFIDHAIHYLSQFGFDGLEIHWEFPTADDRKGLADFIKECKTQFNNFNLILTLNVATNPSIIDAYDIEVINRFSDFVHLMTYDFHGYYEGFTNYISPLHANEQEYSVDKAVQTYIKRGLNPQKIVVGIATYAKSYLLLKKEMHDVGSPVMGPGFEGPFTRTKGYLAYYEVCGDDWFHVHDSTGHLGAYAIKDQQWASYNDLVSIKTKIKYVVNEQLLGVSFWSLDQDDFNGFCRNGPFSLINTARRELHLSRHLEKRPTESPNVEIDRCMTDGFFPNQMDCRKFFQCSRGMGQSRSCGQPLYWNQTCECCVVSNEHCVKDSEMWS